MTANGGTVAGAEAALANGFASGTSYLNVHSTTFPGGEIRSFFAVTAFVNDIPSLSRLGLGLLVALLATPGAFVLRRFF